MAVKTDSMPELNDTDKEVLEVLKQETRANPYLIREKTGFEKGDVNSALVRLSRENYVRRVTRGLYEFVEEPEDG